MVAPSLDAAVLTRPSLLAVCTLPAWPIQDGYSLRVANLLRELSPGWSITLLAPGARPPGIKAHRRFDLAGPGLAYPWRFDPTILAAAIRRGVVECQPDCVLLWPGSEAAWLGLSSPAPAVMDMIDCNPLELWRGVIARAPLRERLRDLRQIGVAARYARQIVRGVAETVCAGEQDAAWMARIGGRTRVHVVPNGVNVPPQGSLVEQAGQPTVCFTGTLDFAPNVDAVRFLTDEIWPLVRQALPAARLFVAGRRPLPEILAQHGAGGIEVAADVPDLAAVLGRARVAIAPMRTGAGIKNKVLEAWACARPVVMTRLATNGLVLPPGHERLVGRSAGSLADAVIGLLHDDAARRLLGLAARAHAEQTCSWQAAAARLDQILRSVIRTGQPPSSHRP